MYARRSASAIVCLLLFSLISATIIPAGQAELITSIEKWTQSRELAEDVIIKPGAELTIEAGVDIEITADITISVDGTLILSGTTTDGVSIAANITQSSEGGSLSLWQGIVISSGGTLIADNASIGNAVIAIDVNSGATSELTSLIFNESTNGLFNSGTTTITSSGCEDVQNICIDNSGSITASSISATDSGQLIANSGDGAYSDLTATSTGVVIGSADTATGSFSAVSVSDAGLVLRTVGDQAGTSFVDFDVTGVDLLIDAAMSSDLSIDDIEGTDVDSVLLADDADGLSLSNSTISGDDSPYIAIRANTVGSLTLDEVTLDGHSQSFLLTGGGDHDIDDSSLSADLIIGQITSATSLSVEGGTWSGGTDGLDIQHSSAELENLNISIGDGHGTAIRALGSTLDIVDEANLSHVFEWGDSTSTGIHAIWSDIDADSLSISGFSTGVSCETTSQAHFDSLSISDIGNDGYRQSCSSTSIDTLDTAYGDHGLVSLSGSISIAHWNADSHTTSILLSEAGASTYVRDWSGSNVVFAAQGEAGELFYGTDDISANSVQVTGAEIYTESSIEITDLSGDNPIENVEVSLHGFSEVSDASGLVTLPLAAVDISVTAFDPAQSIGREKSLSTIDASPRIELPVLPDDGSDWIIEDGVSILLERFSGDLTSNIVIQSGGSLELIDSDLSSIELMVDAGGSLSGTDSTLSSDGFSLNSSTIGAVGDSLVLAGSININCETTSFSWNGIYLEGTVHLNTVSGCTVYLYDGGTSGDVTIAAGGSLSQFSDLRLTVLDEGVPIQGAEVSLNDTRDPNEITNATTDVDGTASLRALGLTFDETGLVGGFDVGRTVSMDITSSSISQNQYWGASTSAESTFIASTLASDEVTNYRNLQNAWSPYYLFDDLVVSGLMEIDDGVDLQISTGVSITVEGVLSVGSASLHGDDWAGLVISGGEADLTDSYLLNAVQSLTLSDAAAASLDGVTLYNSISGHVKLESGSSIEISESSLAIGDDCITTESDSSILLSIDSSSISDCGVGMRIYHAGVDIDGLDISNSGTGARLVSTSGTLQAISVVADEAGLELLDITEGETSLLAAELIATQGAGLSLEDSTGLSIGQVNASSIHLTRTTLSLSDSTTDELLISGTRSDDYSYIHNVTASTLNATATSGQLCLWITNSTFSATDSSDLCMFVWSSSLGDFSFTSDFGSSILLFDSTAEAISIAENAIVAHYQAHTVEFSLLTAPISLNAWDNPISFSSYWNGTSPTGVAYNFIPLDPISLPYIYINWRLDYADDSVIFENQTLITFANIFDVSGEQVYTLDDSFSITVGPNASTHHSIDLEVNTPPVVSLTMPEGMTSIEQGSTTTPSGAPNAITITATDEHGILLVMGSIVNLDTDESVSISGEGPISLSGLREGDQLLTLLVKDEYGAATTITQTFTITPPDADDDNLETCDPVSWYDNVQQRMCGPDNVDLDDDNDGLRDEVDAFPYDECATIDTDEDGQPDEIVEGCTTSLFEDEDDDGDGIPDSEESGIGSKGSDGGPDFMTILSILLLVIIGGAALRRFRQDEG